MSLVKEVKTPWVLILQAEHQGHMGIVGQENPA